MIDWRRLGLRSGIVWLAIYALLGVAGLGLYFAAGLYNVAASDRHRAVSETLIKFVLVRSVATHSDASAVPDLSDDGMAALGARHYAIGCMPCHGSVAAPGNPVVNMMYPAPPALHDAVKDWRTEELFWIVKNGLKFTGMPAWPGDGRDDEVWAVVAFILRLPSMDEAQFATLAGEGLLPPAQGRSLRFADPTDRTIAFCGACHGSHEALPVSDAVPPLNGQHAAYLQRALAEYRNNTRQSGIMEPIAAALGDGVAARLAEHYANQPRAGAGSTAAADDRIARGRRIAEQGLPDRQVPACMACHSGARSPQFPMLGGLPEAYVATQLRLFKDGRRDTTTYGRIMSVVARRLAADQIDAVAAYIATLPPGSVPDGLAAVETAP